MRLLYTIGIFFYRCGIAVASLFNSKAKLWMRGRKGLFEQLGNTFDGTQRPVWVHCASLGEYEQAKPVIEQIKCVSPHTQVLLTFFSPSGYEVSKSDPLPDYIFYLPIDLPRKVKQFMNAVRPQIAIFVKYEFWFNYMFELNRQGIPFYYISAIFRPSQYFFKKTGRWFGLQLQKASFFFVQNAESKALLESIGITQVEICGDTRFDRVYDIAKQSDTIPFMESFQQGAPIIVAGSTWAPDEQVLAQVLEALPQYKMVVAPHEISRSADLLKAFASFPCTCLSKGDEQELSNSRVLIIDTIGLLKKLYRYGRICYVGGGFKTGLHNTLEAAVYGTPVFFGPEYQKFNEAVALVNRHGAFSISNADELLQKIHYFDEKPDAYQETCRICQAFVQENIGSCVSILQTIQKNIL